MLKDWCTRFGAESEELRGELAAWTRWLANGSPPWAAYRALIAGRLVAIDKNPGVRPVGIGEAIRRLMEKLVHSLTGKWEGQDDPEEQTQQCSKTGAHVLVQSLKS